jgi:hypothetical protein
MPKMEMTHTMDVTVLYTYSSYEIQTFWVKRPRKANSMKSSITSLLQNGEKSTPILGGGVDKIKEAHD